ncbi:hypothetical protein IMY05_C4591000100 [Salix suchowensis]|nr:hypothetical protein IMY05_C4591000100 [Salix suchowensis]
MGGIDEWIRAQAASIAKSIVYHRHERHTISVSFSDMPPSFEDDLKKWNEEHKKKWDEIIRVEGKRTAKLGRPSVIMRLLQQAVPAGRLEDPNMYNHSDILLHRPPPPYPPHRRNTSRTFVSLDDPPFCAVKHSPPLPPLPDHWNCEFDYPKPWGRVATLAFRMAVLISFGHDNLDSVWEICHSEERWAHDKDRFTQRTTTTTVVVRASYLWSVLSLRQVGRPPGWCDGRVYNNHSAGRGAAELHATWTVFAPPLVLLYHARLADHRFEHDLHHSETLMATRSKVLCTFVLIAYPFVTVGIATALTALGLHDPESPLEAPFVERNHPFYHARCSFIGRGTFYHRNCMLLCYFVALTSKNFDKRGFEPPPSFDDEKPACAGKLLA